MDNSLTVYANKELSGTEKDMYMLKPVHFISLLTQLETLMENTGWDIDDFICSCAIPLVVPNPLKLKRNEEHRMIKPEKVAGLPYFWLPEELKNKRLLSFTDEGKDGSKTKIEYFEDDSMLAFRIVYVLAESGLLNMETGRFVDVFSMLKIEISKLEIEQKYDNWVIGNSDYLFDQIKLDEIIKFIDLNSINRQTDDVFNYYEDYCLHKMLMDIKDFVKNNVAKEKSVNKRIKNLSQCFRAILLLTPISFDKSDLSVPENIDKNNVVSVASELFEYLKTKIKRTYENSQHFLYVTGEISEIGK